MFKLDNYYLKRNATNEVVWVLWLFLFTLYDLGFGILLMEPESFGGKQAVGFLLWGLMFSGLLLFHASLVTNDFSQYMLEAPTRAKIFLIHLGSLVIAASILVFSYAEHASEVAFLVLLIIIPGLLALMNYKKMYEIIVYDS